MHELVLTKQAAKFLQKIPLKHAAQITRKIDVLREDPNALDTKQLEGYPQYRRAKSGEYRIIYRIEHEKLILLVVRLGKRNDNGVYQNLDLLKD